MAKKKNDVLRPSKGGFEDGIEDTGYEEGEDYSDGPEKETLATAEEKEVDGMNRALKDHLIAIIEKHKPADPNLPSPTEINARAHALRALQLLSEAAAAAAKAASYEVPEEDEKKRAEAKENAAKLEQAAKAKEQTHV